MGTAPTVASLHRYPVKSLSGESVTWMELDSRGCVGDRLWSVRTAENKIGSGKSTRRFAAVPGLLELRARACDGAVLVTFPDGVTRPVDDPDASIRLSRHSGSRLRFARESAVSHFDDGPVSLIGTATMRAIARAQGADVDVRRFRPNIVLDTVTAFAEDDWVGRRLRLGTAVLEVTVRSTRCVMVDMATADLPAQNGNLRATGRLNDTCAGVIAAVVRPGRISVGDEVLAL